MSVLGKVRSAAKEWLGYAELGLANTGPLIIPYMGSVCPRGVHEWLPFEGGYGCAHCPAWVGKARKGESVERDPAGPIDLAKTVEDIKARFVPAEQPALPTLTGPVRTPEVQAYEDRLLAIVNAMLPIVREDASLTHLLHVAQQIDLIQ